MDVRIQDLDFGVGLDLARQHLAGYAAFDAKRLRPKTMQLKRDSFEVEYDIGRVFDDARYRRELVQHALDLHSRYSCSLDRRKQRASQTISDGSTKPTLKGLSVELGITVGGRFIFAREAFWPLEANHELRFCSVHRFLSERVI